jgi:hypothetical protein
MFLFRIKNRQGKITGLTTVLAQFWTSSDFMNLVTVSVTNFQFYNGTIDEYNFRTIPCISENFSFIDERSLN